MTSMPLLRPLVFATLVLLPTGCGEAEDAVRTITDVQALTSPAGAESSAPNLAVGPDGRVYLSWIEGAGDGNYELRFATLHEDRWSEPRTVASGTDWFVNWADFPAMTVLPSGRLAAHYLERPSTEGGAYAYHVRVVQSSDGGESWSEAVTPHRDRTLTEHGFVSLFAAGGDSLGIVWLDGRGFADEFGATGEMSLRNVSMAANGALGPEKVVDTRTCECCQTSVAVTDAGPVVVYRDRTNAEIRDIYLSRLSSEGWMEGRPVHRDGWEINACPVNGPAIASDGAARVAVAWFTGAADSARVNVSFSDDHGETFGQPVSVDEGAPLGRVGAAMLPDGSALVSWLESGDGEGANVLVRRVAPDGHASAPQVVTTSSGARSSGVPRMAVSGDRVVIAWTAPEDPTRVMTAQLQLPGLGR